MTDQIGTAWMAYRSSGGASDLDAIVTGALAALEADGIEASPSEGDLATMRASISTIAAQFPERAEWLPRFRILLTCYRVLFPEGAA